MKIIKVVYVEKHPDYTRTHVILEDGMEATGWGELEIGDEVAVFYHRKYDAIKVRKITRHIPVDFQSS